MTDPKDVSHKKKLTCDDALDLLHGLIQNELEDDEAEAVLTHLARCKSCRLALTEHVKLSGLLQSNMPWLGGIYFNRKYSPSN